MQLLLKQCLQYFAGSLYCSIFLFVCFHIHVPHLFSYVLIWSVVFSTFTFHLASFFALTDEIFLAAVSLEYLFF